MKTFALRNGDLVLSGDKYAMVEGAARLQQQVGLALKDKYRSDRFHPEWGSVLRQFVGYPYGVDTPVYIRAEVNRVIRGFVALQNNMLRSRSISAKKPTLSSNEIISEVKDIQIDQNQDTMNVKVSLVTASRQQIDVLASPEGA